MFVLGEDITEVLVLKLCFFVMPYLTHEVQSTTIEYMFFA